MNVIIHSCNHIGDYTHKLVSKETPGQTELNLILSFANSTAMVFVAPRTAHFEALYQVKFGRGRIPAVEEIVTKEPPFFFCIYGTIVLAEYSDFTFTAMTLSYSSSVTSRVDWYRQSGRNI